MWAYQKYCPKLYSTHMDNEYIKHKQILCLCLNPIPKISHYVYANIPKYERIQNQNCFWPHSKSLRTGYSPVSGDTLNRSLQQLSVKLIKFPFRRFTFFICEGRVWIKQSLGSLPCFAYCGMSSFLLIDTLEHVTHSFIIPALISAFPDLRQKGIGLFFISAVWQEHCHEGGTQYIFIEQMSEKTATILWYLSVGLSLGATRRGKMPPTPPSLPLCFIVSELSFLG